MFKTLDIALDQLMLELPRIRRDNDDRAAPPLFTISMEPKRLTKSYTLERCPPIHVTSETIALELHSSFLYFPPAHGLLFS